MKSNEKILIAIATFNEMENIPGLVREIRNRLSNVDILVIDDNSPDGTWEWVQKASESDLNLHLLHRKSDRGLGRATIAGLGFGIEAGHEWIATLDADFSHDPDSLVEMLGIATSQDSNCDVVIGSRYVDGGGIEGWPFYRRVASRYVNWLARFWLGLKPKDNTGAFRIYRTEVLREIRVRSVKSGGYGYLEEILLRLQRVGARIVEHPITFRDREHGKSKAGLMIGLAVVREILTMRFR